MEAPRKSKVSIITGTTLILKSFIGKAITKLTKPYKAELKNTKELSKNIIFVNGVFNSEMWNNFLTFLTPKVIDKRVTTNDKPINIHRIDPLRNRENIEYIEKK